MQSDQRRRTSGIDSEARAAQIEDIGNTVGEDAQRIPRHEIRVSPGRIAEAQIGVIGGRCADIDPGLGAGELARPDSGIFERVPNEFKQQPLLRVHLHRLARRDPEKRRLELVDATNQAGRPSVAFAWFTTIWMIEKSSRPSLRIDLRDCVSAGGEQLPKPLQAVTPRKSAGCSDDCDRSVTHSSRTVAPEHQLSPFAPSRSKPSPRPSALDYLLILS